MPAPPSPTHASALGGSAIAAFVAGMVFRAGSRDLEDLN
jgi:hypothetical protein